MNGTSGPAGAGQEREPSAPPAIKRMRAAMTAASVLVLLLLGVFAYSLIDSQRKARDDVEHRFEDVADVSAALTIGVFDVSAAGSAQQAMAQLGTRRIDPRRLEALTRRNDRPYSEVFDARGRRIAATAHAPRDAAAPGAVRLALATNRARLTNAIGSGPDAVVEWAIPFRSAAGRRVYVTTIPLRTLGGFLAGFLGRVPNFAQATSEVVDGRGIVLGASGGRVRLGEPFTDRELLAAARRDGRGDYGDDRYFASAPITGSPWHVLIDTSRSNLYESVDGSRRTIPWLLFVAFALAALVGLYMMRRSALAAAELQRRELNERHAVEINDNIIQGLALAAYELEREEKSAGSAQVVETLREAQQLVSQLLGDDQIEPGRLRRDSAARIRGARDEPERRG